MFLSLHRVCFARTPRVSCKEENKNTNKTKTKTQTKTHKHTHRNTQKHTNTTNTTNKHNTQTSTQTSKQPNKQKNKHTNRKTHNRIHYSSSRGWTSAPQRLEPRWSYLFRNNNLFGVRKFCKRRNRCPSVRFGRCHFWHPAHDCVQQPTETAETASVVSTSDTTLTPHASAERTAHLDQVVSHLGSLMSTLQDLLE